MRPDYIVEMCERLAKLETLMDNHLKTHEQWLVFFILPILGMVSYMFIKDIWLIIKNKKK